jgi:hydroxyethylthiazole kinase
MKITNGLDVLTNPLTNITEPFTLESLWHDVNLIRQTNPLIHNITNLVVMPITANLLLALGAAPIMAHAPSELDEIIQLAHALVINIGTLDEIQLAAIQQAQQAALKRRIPIVFDPVGAGASTYRTASSLNIIHRGVDLIRGNASEIMALLDTSITTKGVDSLQSSENALASAKILTQRYQCVVAVSGPTDFIINPINTFALPYGTHLLTKVVGMGCSLTAMMACFLAVNPNPTQAAIHAMAWMGLVSEYAEKKSNGPGSFYSYLLDSFYNVQKKEIRYLLERRVTV